MTRGGAHPCLTPLIITLHPIEGFEFVEGAVTALGSSTELATHLFPGGVRWRVIPARYSPSRQVPTEFARFAVGKALQVRAPQ